MGMSESSQASEIVHLHDEGCFAKQVLDSISAQVAIIDSEGSVVFANHTWREFATVRNFIAETCEGANYLAFLESEKGAHIDGAMDIVQGIRDVLAQRIRDYSREFSAITRKEQRWYTCQASKFRSNNMPLAVLVYEDITERKLIELERNQTIIDLERALSEVRELRGMLPICASCKKVRDDDGYWQEVESYLTKYSGAKLTHGICPDCLSQLYPDVAPKLAEAEAQDSERA